MPSQIENLIQPAFEKAHKVVDLAGVEHLIQRIFLLELRVSETSPRVRSQLVLHLRIVHRVFVILIGDLREVLAFGA